MAMFFFYETNYNVEVLRRKDGDIYEASLQ